MLPLFMGSNSNNNVSSTTTLTYSPEGKPSGNFGELVRLPTEQIIISLTLVLILVSMTTCTPQEKNCNVIHENAPSLQKCEVW